MTYTFFTSVVIVFIGERGWIVLQVRAEFVKKISKYVWFIK